MSNVSLSSGLSSIVIKSSLGDDLRRFTFSSPFSFARLIKSLQDAYSLPSSNFAIKYKDDEGDNVSLTCDLELVDAISNSKNLLKISLTQTQCPAPAPSPAPLASVPTPVPSATPAPAPSAAPEAKASTPSPSPSPVVAESPQASQSSKVDNTKKPISWADLGFDLGQHPAAALEFAQSFIPLAEAEAPTPSPLVNDQNNNDDNNNIRKVLVDVDLKTGECTSSDPNITVSLEAENQNNKDNKDKQTSSDDSDFDYEFNELMLSSSDEGQEDDSNKKDSKDEKDANNEVHTNVICDGCGMNPLVGIRFKCMVCRDYDLCSKCESNNVHNRDHALLKIRNPINYNKPQECPRFRGGRHHGHGGHGHHHGPHGHHGFSRRGFFHHVLASLSPFHTNSNETQKPLNKEERLNKMLEKLLAKQAKLAKKHEKITEKLARREAKKLEKLEKAKAKEAKKSESSASAQPQPEPLPVPVAVCVLEPVVQEQRAPIPLSQQAPAESPAPVVQEQPAPVPLPVPAVPHKFQSQLDELAAMGFNNLSLNEYLLEKASGNLQEVALWLLEKTN